ncbi:MULTISPECIES: hydroxymethylglutaryl-CoA lyase [unclassified Pseudomonas]|uniref:hydroxymethylglutaryl-CoA lyase n=1 Tax=unclassified Pseudomonas TaxID=196821 RepID=UPI0008B276D5|nr:MULTISPECIES: hydroxymethylglutaryl-CoA lyase [unclassified Pseudomonas]PMV18581.1 hydroxymethylglutaryl-CoA lyase [Pseudomonas sp. FW305-3-2-15-C-TSA2]PMV21308.1 hydroxymethylglutaryl-CoA lyase [Pseudomonas sp. DP16D-L5]PMV34364.1 hydroxymethylglutaryl-CoA lyase [Pseudomonas sp. FW305-3-2-15-A-LB2]PMV39718.1 hydroxymethylglutaryl-CoA lyase [Pseudomonas sp. FW305-3-2-15-C-R2A1]PMV44583.1 hydroxymethylglutaryl-CoA lyase [Pseudomonas sp. FW305-3-2-15-C-LB1]
MISDYCDPLIVQEVSPRDGLQIEPTWVETADKIALIDQLSLAGFSRIEAGSFVSPKAIPALRDGEQVFQGIDRKPGVIYVALIPNLKGAQRAIESRADELNLVMSASQTHNLANMRMRCEASLAAFGDITRFAADHPVRLNGSIATTFGCPFEGRIDEDRVLRIVDAYLQLGIQGISLADTTGMANPRQVERLVKRVLQRVSARDLTLHFHNTRGLGLCNVLAAYEAGARRFDAALGGLGGCPFAPGASGNICTEDLVNLCDEVGIHTGIDLPHLLHMSRRLPALLGHDLPGQVAKAGRNGDLHAPPAYIATL